MHKGLRITAVTIVAALVGSIGFMAVAGAAPTGEPASGEAVSYVGKVKELRASLAVVVQDDAAFGYLCDGEAISEWFRGSVEDGVISLASPDGSALIAEVKGAKLSGDVFVADATGEFSLKEAKGDAGLFRFEQVIDGIGYAAGWVVQPSGGTVGQVSIAALPEGAAVAPPPLLTRIPPTVEAAVGVNAGQVAPLEVVAQLPPAPPPANEVVAVPTSTGVVTDTGADDSGGGNPGQTQGDTEGGPPPTDPPVTEGYCEDLGEELGQLNKRLDQLNKSIEEGKNLSTKLLRELKGARSLLKNQISKVLDDLDDCE